MFFRFQISDTEVLKVLQNWIFCIFILLLLDEKELYNRRNYINVILIM